MGTRVITEASRLSLKGGLGNQQSHVASSYGLSNKQLSNQNRMDVIYDGTTGKQGLSQDLPHNVTWVDPSGFWKSGSNFGPSFANTGKLSCTISGCSASRDYAYNPTADKVTELTPLWTVVATIAPGAVADAGSKIYSLLKFEFAATLGQTGSVTVLNN